MNESGCPTRWLAEGPACRVERCAHGTVHMTLGVLILRLTDRQLEEIAATLELELPGSVPCTERSRRGCSADVDPTPLGGISLGSWGWEVGERIAEALA